MNVIRDPAQMDIEDAVSASRPRNVEPTSAKFIAGVMAKALSNVRAATIKHSVPVLECVLMQVSSDTIRLTCTDMEIAIIDEVKAETQGEWGAAVPVERLHDFCKGVPPTQELTATRRGSDLHLIGGRFCAVIRTEDEADFPIIRAKDATHTFEVPVSILTGVVGATLPCASRDATRQYLQGICIHPREGGLQFVATDQNIMGIAFASDIAGCENIGKFILPARSASELKKIAAECIGVVEFEVSTNLVQLRAGTRRLTTKLIDGVFPEYQFAIPRENSSAINFAAKDVLAALKIAHSFSESGRIPIVVLTISESGLTIAGKNATAGEATTQFDANEVPLRGDSVSIAFNASYLATAISAIGGEVEMAFQDDSTSVLLRRPDQTGPLYVVMPLRF